MADFTHLLLGNRYQVGDTIGRGGMAEVRIGRDTRLGRTVAIKMLRSDLARDPSFQSRFQREAEAAASLNHPNIVAVYDSGEETQIDANGQEMHQPYIVMEYVEGHTVRELLHDGSALPINEAIDITIGVLDALDYAHRSGIVHRDIKPANIMLTTGGRVKVMDFGIARAMADNGSTMTQTQAVIGTAQYLSPEQARGETVDARSDLYSAGCVLYELLTGRTPFVADSAVAVAYQHVRENPAPPSAYAPDVPEVLDRICSKALAKDRESRYQSAAEFRADLVAAREGGIVNAPAVGVLAGAATQVLTPDAPTQAMAPTMLDTALKDNDEALDPEAEKKRKRKILWWSIGGTVAALALIGLLIFLFTRGDGAEQVEIPAVTDGMTAEGAQAALMKAEFVPVARTEASVDVPEGQVTRFSPESGEKADKGSEVEYFVSTGPSAVKVPDVEGMTQDQARKILEDAGLKTGPTKTVQHPSIQKDRVVGTDPGKDASADEGQEITILISSGQTTVPAGLVGMSQDDARRALEGAGLSMNIAERRYIEGTPAGQVLEADHASGDILDQKQTVNVVVSRGAEDETVPGVTGLSADAAEQQLQARGFKVNRQVTNDSTVPSGQVVRTDPPAGGSIKEGGTITIFVSTGPAPSAPPTSNPAPPMSQ